MIHDEYIHTEFCIICYKVCKSRLSQVALFENNCSAVSPDIYWYRSSQVELVPWS